MCAERAAGVGRAGRWEPCSSRPGGVKPEEHAQLPGTVLWASPKPSEYAEG